MSTLSKEHVKQLVRENNFQNVSDVNAYLKDIFKDIIQELLEAELEAKLGYAKDDIESKNTDNGGVRAYLEVSSDYMNPLLDELHKAEKLLDEIF